MTAKFLIARTAQDFTAAGGPAGHAHATRAFMLLWRTVRFLQSAEEVASRARQDFLQLGKRPKAPAVYALAWDCMEAVKPPQGEYRAGVAVGEPAVRAWLQDAAGVAVAAQSQLGNLVKSGGERAPALRLPLLGFAQHVAQVVHRVRVESYPHKVDPAKLSDPRRIAALAAARDKSKAPVSFSTVPDTGGAPYTAVSGAWRTSPARRDDE